MPSMSDSASDAMLLLPHVTALNEAIQILLAGQRWLLAEIEANHPIDLDDLARITTDLARALESSWRLEEELKTLCPQPSCRSVM
jgi:hypothetical protein